MDRRKVVCTLLRNLLCKIAFKYNLFFVKEMNNFPVEWITHSPMSNPTSASVVLEQLTPEQFDDLSRQPLEIQVQSIRNYWKRVARHPEEYSAPVVAQLIVGQSMGNNLYPSCAEMKRYYKKH